VIGGQEEMSNSWKEKKILNFLLVQAILYRNVTIHFGSALFYAGCGSRTAKFWKPYPDQGQNLGDVDV
jgi:hypothetical protein